MKEQADVRLEAALETTDAGDPRPLYRPAMKYLKDRDPAAFARALDYYERELVPAVAGGADALRAWREYGLVLAQALGPGRVVEVDEGGRARPLEELASHGPGLVLYLPDKGDAPPVPLRSPAQPAPAQKATLEVLVEGKVTASAYD